MSWDSEDAMQEETVCLPVQSVGPPHTTRYLPIGHLD